MTIKATIFSDGTLTVVNDNGGAITTDGSPMQSRWDIKAQQIGMHLLGVQNVQHPFNGLSAGDKSAALDAYNQFKGTPMK